MNSFHRVLPHAVRAAPFRSFEERLGLAVFVFALLFASVQPLWAHEYKMGTIEVIHPWSRETPPGAKVAAGYVTIENDGTTSDRLVSATAEIAGKTEIHEMAVDAQGVMTMRPVEGGIELTQGAKTELKPGAFHIMFMDLNAHPKKGERFKGTLTFEKAGTIDVEYAVDAIGGEPAGDHDHSHMNHGG